MTAFACLHLYALNLAENGLQRRRHQLVHFRGIVPFNEIRSVAIAAEQLIKLLMADPGQHGGIGDLIAVQVQDRQDGAIRGRV